MLSSPRQPVRVAVLGVSLLLGLSSAAWASGLKKHCPDCDGSSRGVGTRDTTTIRVSRSVPMLGTVYLPMAAMPMPVPAGGVREVADDEDETFRTAMAAAKASLRQEITRGALKAEIEAKQRFLERLGAFGSGGATGTATPTDIDERLKKVSEQINQLSERVASVERLVLIHDNYLREQVQQSGSGTPTKPNGKPETGPAKVGGAPELISSPPKPANGTSELDKKQQGN